MLYVNTQTSTKIYKIMKKLLFILLLALGASMVLNAKKIEGSEKIWRSLQRDQCVLNLMSFGGYENGVELNRFFPQEKNNNECCALIDNSFYHLGTLDGDFLYDADIQGQYIHISNKRKVLGDNEVSVDSKYSGWIKLVWLEKSDGKTIIYTIDSLGTYRYFQCVKGN